MQMSRIISKYSAVGVTMPPVLQTGSRITPAIVSAPSLVMTSSKSRAQNRLVSSHEAKRSRIWIGDGTLRKPAGSGWNFTLRCEPPPAAIAPSVEPW